MASTAVVRVTKKLIAGCAVLTIAASLWALRVELIFEGNIRRGIPADFRERNAHRPFNWKV
jgi:hypothetical protein